MKFDVNKELERRSVSSARGAPMGRVDHVHDEHFCVHLQKVQFVDGDYDAGGAYWGGGSPLYCAMSESGLTAVFLRSENWQAAKAALRQLHPGLQVIDAPVAPADARWWTTGSGYVELKLGLQDARGCAHAGQCDADVEALSLEPYVAEQLEVALDPDNVKATLADWGAWDAEELADHAQNLQRLLWLACCDLAEENVE